MHASNLDAVDSLANSISQMTIHANASNPTRLQSRFFSKAELENIDVGRGIILDRIAQKQAVIDFLSNPDKSFVLKQLIAQEDFGVVFHAPGSRAEEGIESGFRFYCDYLAQIIRTYSFADQLAQSMLLAESMADKNRHQNSLYYFLSYHIVFFKESITSTFQHKIPEHSLEDTFYEMIMSKMCTTATKEYDVVTTYLKLSKTPLGIKRQIDNKRLYDGYQAKHREAMLIFNNRELAHPVTWLGNLEDREIKESATTQFNKVSSALQKCVEDIVKIRDTLSRELNGHSYDPATPEDDILYIYNYFGPHVLQAIGGFEETTRAINALKEDSDRWLRGIKDKKKLYQRIPKEQQGAITGYFSYWEEKARAEERAVAQKKAAERLAQEEAKRAEKREKERLRKERKALRDAEDEAKRARDSQLAAINAGDADELGTPNLPPVLNTAKMAAVAAPLAIMPSQEDLPAVPKVEEDPSTVASVHKEATAPRIKYKTRKADPSLLLPAPEEAKEHQLTPTLPAEFTTAEFTSFVEDLLNENNERKLISRFKELKTIFGLDVDTSEKKNKGYFSIISPIDQMVKIATYHHCHTENPFGSIFMAVKDVLIAARIIQR